MQLLRDNLTLWTSDMQNPGSSLGVSGGSVGRLRSFRDATSYKGGIISYNPTKAYLIGGCKGVTGDPFDMVITPVTV